MIGFEMSEANNCSWGSYCEYYRKQISVEKCTQSDCPMRPEMKMAISLPPNPRNGDYYCCVCPISGGDYLEFVAHNGKWHQCGGYGKDRDKDSLLRELEQRSLKISSNDENRNRNIFHELEQLSIKTPSFDY